MEKKEKIIEVNEVKKQNVYKKLQHARVMLQEKNNKKSGKNKFAGFNYYELADFMPSVNDIFDKVGLFSMFNIKEETATLLIINVDNVTDTITFESPIAQAEIKGSTPIQCLGGIHTYMKRYLYLNALEIVESEMFDAKVGDKKDPLVEGKAKIEEKKIEKKEENYRELVIKYCNEHNININEIAQIYKLNSQTNNDIFEKVYFDLTINGGK